MSKIKRKTGRYFTEINPFKLSPFLSWAEEADIRNKTILEPCAGSNNLIHMLQDLNLIKTFSSYDINPKEENVKKRNTLKNFPINYSVCITNMPWLAKNSAKRRGIVFPKCKYQDIYQLYLEKILYNCSYAATLVPESFITSNLFQSRLGKFISIPISLFTETDNPVGLALFYPNPTKTEIYRLDEFIGDYDELKKFLPKKCPKDFKIEFNSSDGKLGLIAIDNSKKNSIRFCKSSSLKDYVNKKSNRSMTQINTDKFKIGILNDYLNNFRKNTGDVFLTSFKGIRKDGMYRRRLDWELAKDIIWECSN